MLQNAYFLAKIGADTAENEQHFAEILLKTGNYPTEARLRNPIGLAIVSIPLVSTRDHVHRIVVSMAQVVACPK